MKIREQLRARYRAAEPKPFDARAERAAERAEAQAETNEAISAVFECRRTGVAPCECGRPGRNTCAFPLRGRKAGQACGRAICETHTHGAPGYCLAHDTIRKKGT